MKSSGQYWSLRFLSVLNEGARILNPADIFPAAVPSVWRCTSSCHWKFTEENSTKRYSWPRCQEHINSGSLEQFMEMRMPRVSTSVLVIAEAFLGRRIDRRSWRNIYAVTALSKSTLFPQKFKQLASSDPPGLY